MFVERFTVAVTTGATEAAEEYTPVARGRVLQVQYVKDDFANGVDFTITTETTGQTVWTESDVNASAVRCPRQPAHSGVGAALVLNSDDDPVAVPIHVAGERIKIVIANGGVAKAGTFHVTIG
jgi:hypothetical protein